MTFDISKIRETILEDLMKVFHSGLIVTVLFVLFWPVSLFSQGKSMEKVYIMAVGDISNELILEIKEPVEKIFGFPVYIKAGFSDVEFAYNNRRKQYYAPKILKRMKKYITEDTLRLVGITDKDLYDKGLNFILGEAGGKVCIVSANRFRPCTVIDTEYEKNILLERLIKTVIHELGHTFGLRHCDNKKCVIFFSNWIGDTDRKTKNFCRKHKQELKKIGIAVR